MSSKTPSTNSRHCVRLVAMVAGEVARKGRESMALDQHLRDELDGNGGAISVFVPWGCWVRLIWPQEVPCGCEPQRIHQKMVGQSSTQGERKSS